MDDFSAWVGRSETTYDALTSAALDRLAAVLDYPSSPWPKGKAPPLAHWLCFLPAARQSELDVDGHPKRGGFLPPVPLPRRMWAGGQLEFLAPVPLDTRLERRSAITKITAKRGASGSLVFVTVRHEISADGQLAVVEDQDIVYREAAGVAGTPTASTEAPSSTADVVRRVTPTPQQLFRFSALTFNAHRIHYDRTYAREEEGYAGLVVHGPLLATLLVDHFLSASSGQTIRHFSFRGSRPVLDTTPFDLSLAWTEIGAKLWAQDLSPGPNFQAEVTAAV